MNLIRSSSDSSIFGYLSNIGGVISRLYSLSYVNNIRYPVYLLKPGVVLQGKKAGPPEPALRVLLVEQLVHQLLSLVIFEIFGEFQLGIEHIFIDLKWVFSFLAERHITAHHFIQIDTERVQAG